MHRDSHATLSASHADRLKSLESEACAVTVKFQCRTMLIDMVGSEEVSPLGELPCSCAFSAAIPSDFARPLLIFFCTALNK